VGPSGSVVILTFAFARSLQIIHEAKKVMSSVSDRRLWTVPRELYLYAIIP
jgi:hypothetical protein